MHSRWRRVRLPSNWVSMLCFACARSPQEDHSLLRVNLVDRSAKAWFQPTAFPSARRPPVIIIVTALKPLSQRAAACPVSTGPTRRSPVNRINCSCLMGASSSGKRRATAYRGAGRGCSGLFHDILPGEIVATPLEHRHQRLRHGVAISKRLVRVAPGDTFS